MIHAHRILANLLTPFGNAAALQAIGAGLPYLSKTLLEVASGFVQRHFKSGKIVQQVFLRSLMEAEKLVQAWIEDKEGIFLSTRGKELLRRGSNAPLSAFADWIDKRGLSEKWSSLLSGNNEELIRRHLRSECQQIADTLRQQIREDEFTEGQLVDCLVASAELVTDGDPDSVGSLLPTDTLLYQFSAYRGFDLYTSTFAVSFRCILAESPELQALLNLNTQQAVERAHSELRRQLQHGLEVNKESLSELGQHLAANENRLKRIELSIAEVADSEMIVQELAKCLDETLTEDLWGIQLSLQTDIAENRRTLEEVLARLNQLELTRSRYSKGIIEPSASEERILFNAQSELLRHPPDTPNMVAAIEKLVARFHSSGNISGACDFLHQILEAYPDRAPACIYQAAFQAEVERNNGSYHKRPAKRYQKMLELDPDLALFPQEYEMISMLGRGQFGPVFLVQKKRIGVEFALKVLEPRGGAFMACDLRREVENHVQAAAEDPTGTIVKIFDAEDPESEASRQPFVLLEYVRGKTFAEMYKSRFDTLRRAGNFDQIINTIFYRMLRAVEYLHGRVQPIVHRDLHQGNFMIERNGAVRLIDFGLSKLLDTRRRDQDAAMTFANWPICTAAVSPPESSPPRPELQRRRTFDVFYLGHLGTFLYTKRESRFQAVENERVRRVLLKAAENDPDDRYVSAGQMREAFEEALGGVPDMSNDAIRAWAARAYPSVYQDLFEKQNARRRIEEDTLKGDVTSIDRDGVRISSNGRTYLIPTDQVSHTKDYSNASIHLRDARDVCFRPCACSLPEDNIAEQNGEPIGSIIAAAQDPWDNLEEQLEPGLTCRDVLVDRITERGVSVELTPGLHGISAYVPAKELSIVLAQTPMRPKHWIDTGEPMAGLTLTDVDPDSRTVLASRQPSLAKEIADWRSSLRDSGTHDGVVVYVNKAIVLISLGSHIDAPVATMTTTAFANQLSLEAPQQAVGDRVCVGLQNATAWPDEPLDVARIAMLDGVEQTPLRRATVTRIDNAGHSADLKVEEESGEVSGRLLCRDYVRHVTPTLHRFLDVGSETWVRRVRQRLSGKWDYCAPPLESDVNSQWLPSEGELVEIRLTDVREDRAVGFLPGEFVAEIPKYLLRSRSIRDRHQIRNKPHYHDHLRLDYLYRKGQRVEGYLFRSNGRMEFCPRWAHDDAYTCGHLEQRYSPNTTHTGVIVWVARGDKREVYVLLEAGIEACYRPTVQSSDKEATPVDLLATYIGRRVRVDVDTLDARHKTVRLGAVRPQE